MHSPPGQQTLQAGSWWLQLVVGVWCYTRRLFIRGRVPFIRSIGKFTLTALVINAIIRSGIFGLPSELTRLLGRASPLCIGGVRMASRVLIMFLFFTSIICLRGQQQKAESLTVPPYHNLPTTEGYFQGAGGVRLFYRVAGRSGDPIVFLHGGPGGGINIGGYDMEPLASRGQRLLMFDQRGAGRSEIITDPTKLRIEDFVQDVEAFREHFGLKKFGIIGLSWGSAVALKYITMYPDRVTRVVFLSPLSPTFAFYQERLKHLDSLKTNKEREEEQQAREKFRTAPDAEIHQFCNEAFGESHRLYVVDTNHLKQARQDPCAYPVAGLKNGLFVVQAAEGSLGEWDFRHEMKAVKVPALVLEGAETNVPLDATREWVKSLPNAHLLLIPNAGHMNWIDQPEAVISAMDEFFRGSWPAGSKQ
jgi:proline iminopeptidase